MFQRRRWVFAPLLIVLVFQIQILLAKPFINKPFSYNGFSETLVEKAIFLGFIQGMTEWFPISSSGHLVVLQKLFGMNVSVTFDVMIHIGTLIAVASFLRKDLWSVFKTLLKLDFSSSEGKTLIYMVLGTIPVAITGFLLKDFFESLFSNIISTGIALLFNGLILYLTKYSKSRRELNYWDSLLIGFVQSAAIIPGLSRTGMTVSTALLRGVKSEEAYRFSLLLSVLSILGGCIVKLGDVNILDESLTILLGIFIAALTGYLTLKIVRRILLIKHFFRFAYYCIITGVLIIILGMKSN